MFDKEDIIETLENFEEEGHIYGEKYYQRIDEMIKAVKEDNIEDLLLLANGCNDNIKIRRCFARNGLTRWLLMSENVYFEIYVDYDEPILKGVVDVEEMFVQGVNPNPLHYFDKEGNKVLTVAQALDLGVLDEEPSFVTGDFEFEIMRICEGFKHGRKTIDKGKYFIDIIPEEWGIIMYIKISTLLNSSILNEEWVGFQGDSEYFDADGELQFGNWTFVGITEDTKGEIPLDLDDEIPEEALYGDYLFIIKNSNGNVCVVKFGYRSD